MPPNNGNYKHINPYAKPTPNISKSNFIDLTNNNVCSNMNNGIASSMNYNRNQTYRSRHMILNPNFNSIRRSGPMLHHSRYNTNVNNHNYNLSNNVIFKP